MPRAGSWAKLLLVISAALSALVLGDISIWAAWGMVDTTGRVVRAQPRARRAVRRCAHSLDGAAQAVLQDNGCWLVTGGTDRDGAALTLVVSV